MDYTFNPTAGIPKTSFKENSDGSDPYNMTWFSTVQPPENYLRTFSPNKGKTMNEHTDTAFAPMDERTERAVVHSDGTISVPIVEGDTFIDGVRQPKKGEEVIYVQDVEDIVH